MAQVFILGAGFSKAIGEAMPVMPELRDEVLGLLDGRGHPIPNLRPFDNDLEQWLSHLDTDQPWQKDEENLRNRALFVEVAELIHQVVAEKEQLVLKAPQPAWLQSLTAKWAEIEADIITFNYDLLVERSLRTQDKVRTPADLYAVPLSSRTPAGSSRFTSADRPPGMVCQIMKLHGSLNWRYGGITAPVSEELYLIEDPLGWGPDEPTSTATMPRSRYVFDHKVPLIVPPTGSKNSWYGNLVL